MVNMPIGYFFIPRLEDAFACIAHFIQTYITWTVCMCVCNFSFLGGSQRSCGERLQQHDCCESD